MTRQEYTALYAKLHIEPVREDLYLLALTHSSYAHEHNLRNHSYNERLEFLGDAVLELFISESLFKKFPTLPEGKLTRFRAKMVCEETLFKLADQLDLGTYLRLGKGEAAGGGRMRPSLLADALEALIGALYIDLGYQCVRNVLEKLYDPLLSDIASNGVRGDYKTLMQEYAQAACSITPEYRIVAETGPDHSKVFVAQLLLNQEVLGEGSGRSKKEAEQEAARIAYNRLLSSH